MTTNRPRCPVCSNTTKKNGTTTKKTTRWRCTHCGHSFTRTTQTTHKNAATFALFITWITGKKTLTELAREHRCHRNTLARRFTWCWWIQPPTTPDAHRIYDQIFLDGTYLNGGCLLVASTTNHVISWHWCQKENKAAYTALLEPLAPPLIVVIDGGQGAYSAIKALWPTTKIQRCLVHIQRNVRRNTTSRPRTDAGKAIYRIALNLTKITTVEHATTWVTQLHDFNTIYRSYMDEKTYLPASQRCGNKDWSFTHARVRKAYNQLEYAYKRGFLFTWLQPPHGVAEPKALASTTNVLEGGVNAPLKEQARLHRGLPKHRQRVALDWWLYLHTQEPDDPVRIAGHQQWGHHTRELAATVLDTEIGNIHGHDDGRPATFDTAIDSTYSHSMGIRQGSVGR